MLLCLLAFAANLRVHVRMCECATFSTYFALWGAGSNLLLLLLLILLCRQNLSAKQIKGVRIKSKHAQTLTDRNSSHRNSKKDIRKKNSSRIEWIIGEQCGKRQYLQPCLCAFVCDAQKESRTLSVPCRKKTKQNSNQNTTNKKEDVNTDGAETHINIYIFF